MVSQIFFLETMNINKYSMTLISFTADGFPIYYKYTYSNAFDSLSSDIEMFTIYNLKYGERLRDRIPALYREFTDVYSNDYEFL
jgi:hypothetical protein